MALFWFGAFQVGARLLSPFARGRTISNARWFLLGSLALSVACVTVWYVARHDPKTPIPISLILSPVLAVPFAFLLSPKAQQ